MKYEVQIKEVLAKTIIIEAASKADAERIAEQMYLNAEDETWVLTAQDLEDSDIVVSEV